MIETTDYSFPGYTLLSELGHGGLSTVYLADQNVFERQVAFKVMSAAMAQQEGFGERFLREARIVASLNHRNIVQVYDTGERDGNYFLAMEYLPKGDLAALTGRPFAPRDALRIVSSVLEALEFAASRGVVHRDVKPANVMFREDNTVVLVDFGIAFRDQTDERLTRVGTIIGTPRYMSPEQFQGGDIDERSDIYAVGIMLFELLTGYLPYGGDGAVAIGVQHMNQPIPRLPEALAPFQEIIDRALAKHPDERFSSAADFLTALAGLSGSVYAGNGLADDVTLVEQLAVKPLHVFGQGASPDHRAGTLVAAAALPHEPGGAAIAGDETVVPDIDLRAEPREARHAAPGLLLKLEALGLSGPVLAAIGALLLALLVIIWLLLPGGNRRDAQPPGIAGAGLDATTAAASAAPAGFEVDAEALRRELAVRRDARLAQAEQLQPLAAEWAPQQISAAYDRLLAQVDLQDLFSIRAEASRLRDSLDTLLRRSDRRFTAGSTPEEISRAHRACLSFDANCERAWYASERLRERRLSPFRLQRSEVTVAQFAEFVRATGYITDAERRGYSHTYFSDGARRVPALSWRRPFLGDSQLQQELPAVHLSSADARAYCQWRGGRLPTAEEWEYAARGPERRRYTWGDRWDDRLAPLQTERPVAAGTLRQDAFFSGLTEMTGNVWEWVSLDAGGYGLKGGSHREFDPVNMRTPVRREEIEGVTLSDDGMRCAFDTREWPVTRLDR